ncbi:MaoC family dehydratase N-terminal domain-containing protein [Chloroflexota bacterium]
MKMEELKGKVGTEWQRRAYEIEKGTIRRFAQAIDDPNPLWQDEEYARKTGYDSIIAPPAFITTLGMEQLQHLLSSEAAETSLHGSTEIECYQPVRAGDTVTVITKIGDFRQRQGQMGQASFVTFYITYENQRGDLVAKCRQMIVSY